MFQPSKLVENRKRGKLAFSHLHSIRLDCTNAVPLERCLIVAFAYLHPLRGKAAWPEYGPIVPMFKGPSASLFYNPLRGTSLRSKGPGNRTKRKPLDGWTPRSTPLVRPLAFATSRACLSFGSVGLEPPFVSTPSGISFPVKLRRSQLYRSCLQSIGCKVKSSLVNKNNTL